MVRCLVRFAALLLLVVLVPVAAAETGGYRVTPVTPDMVPGALQDPVPVSASDLPPRVIALAALVSCVPAVAGLTGIATLMNFCVWLGYRNAARSTVLRNGNRVRIFEAIRRHPGIRYRELAGMMDLTRGTLRYHIAVLILNGKIVGVSTRNAVAYFENNDRFTGAEMRLILAVRNRNARRILSALIASPGVTRKEIAGMTGLAGPLISWHTKRLSERGILSCRRSGRVVHYSLTNEAAEIFRKIPGSAPDPGAGSGTDPMGLAGAEVPGRCEGITPCPGTIPEGMPPL